LFPEESAVTSSITLFALVRSAIALRAGRFASFADAVDSGVARRALFNALLFEKHWESAVRITLSALGFRTDTVEAGSEAERAGSVGALELA
jgi:hypothetical protein